MPFKVNKKKISQQESTFLGIKCVFLLTYFFLLTFYMKRPLTLNLNRFMFGTLKNQTSLKFEIYIQLQYVQYEYIT